MVGVEQSVQAGTPPQDRTFETGVDGREDAPQRS